MKLPGKLFRLLLSVSLIATIIPSANAWRVDTCNGEVRGLWSKKTFQLNRCSIGAGSSREAVIDYAMNEWEKILGVADRFAWTSGTSSCSTTTGNGKFEVGFTDSSNIDGAVGMAKIRRNGCTWPWSDGNVKEADVFIASHLSLSPIDQNSTGLGARETAVHEFGHVLGANHEDRVMSVMCTSNTCGKQGEWTTSGAHSNRAESLMPDDVAMAVKWHSSSNAGRPDVIASGWTHNGSSPTRTHNSTTTLTRCPGETATVKVSHGNKGKANITSSNPAQALIVLSGNSTISTFDHVASSMNVWGNRGSFFTNNFTFTVPNIPAGTYHVGWVVDSGNTLSEDDEGNNSALMKRKIRIPTDC